MDDMERKEAVRPWSDSYLSPETPQGSREYPAGKKELIFGAAILLLSFFLCNSIVYGGFNLGFSLGLCLCILCGSGYLLAGGHKLTPYSSILLLLSVLVVGESVNGARRWINIAGLQFQPSEIAKFTMIVLFAKLTRSFGAGAKEFRYGVLGFGSALLGILVPLALEKHLSAIMLMGMVAVVMMFVAGTSPKWLLAGAGAAVVFVVVYISFMGYAGDRVTAWLYPEGDPSDTGYQILQSLYAIGSGGLFGLGLGKSRQKYLYLPFQYNDYIFAVVCEELGLVGALLIVALFAALILRGYWIALHARDRFSTVLASGLVTLIAVQTVLNLCVVTNLLPSTGIALPFFSYGGTALAVNLGEMGIVLSISRQRDEIKKQEEIL